MDKDIQYRIINEEDLIGAIDAVDGDINFTKDSGIRDCVWHRIVVDAELDGDDRLEISYSTSHDEFVPEADHGKLVLNETCDALIHAPPGQYIHIKLNASSIPQFNVNHIKIFYDRQPILRYLPSFFQEESRQNDFLDRFLAIFESLLFDHEASIDQLHRFADPMAAPGGYFQWLANWVSLDLYELIGEKNREFILRALEFYQQKGTVSGLENLVTFLTGKKCCIKEYKDNIFRTYGMEPRDWEIRQDTRGDECERLNRSFSITVDTNQIQVLQDMGTYGDNLHYTTDTRGDGIYSCHVIGLYIFISSWEEGFIIKKDDLHKIIESFLPVYVRVEIYLIEELEDRYFIDKITDEYQDSLTAVTQETYGRMINDTHLDHLPWKLFHVYHDEIDFGKTNRTKHRTYHDGVDRELDL